MRQRVVLVIDGARKRALARLGLELSGRFDVVGVAVDERDVEFIVSTLHPDVVLIDLADRADHGLELVPDIRRAAPDATPVLLHALVAQHLAEFAVLPRPIQIADRLTGLVAVPALV